VVYPPELVYNCVLEEAVVNDSTSGVPGAVPPFNGYSATGTWRSALREIETSKCSQVIRRRDGGTCVCKLWNRYSMKKFFNSLSNPLSEEDFAAISNVNLTGKIVIVRYGKVPAYLSTVLVGSYFFFFARYFEEIRWN
jgi:hypothetical protein